MKNTLVTRCCPRLVIRKEMNGIDKKLADILAHLVTIVCTTNNSVLLRTLHMFIVKPHLLAVRKSVKAINIFKCSLIKFQITSRNLSFYYNYMLKYF